MGAKSLKLAQVSTYIVTFDKRRYYAACREQEWDPFVTRHIRTVIEAYGNRLEDGDQVICISPFNETALEVLLRQSAIKPQDYDEFHFEQLKVEALEVLSDIPST